MTFSDICAEVQALRFSSAQSASIKKWVNDRYAALWGMEEWTFRYNKDNVTATTGSGALSSLPTDFGTVVGLWRADGYPLRWMQPKAFYNLYQGSTDTGAPAFYTVINENQNTDPPSILIGPTSNETSATYALLYERKLTPLSADGDVPAIPAEYHYMLVYGAVALGLALYNDFTFQFIEPLWQEQIQAMRQAYLVDQRGENAQWGKDDLEALPTFWGI